MKKILLALGIISVLQLCASAYLYENETSAVSTLEAQGYSKSALEAVDWVNSRNGGKHSKYVRHYNQKKNGILGRAYQALKLYVDPAQDDGRFGDHEIEYSNTWLGNSTHYSSDMSENRQVENL